MTRPSDPFHPLPISLPPEAPDDSRPLAVLDLIPVSSGGDAATALRNTVDLVRRSEQLGYQRHWFAEHHLNPGVIGASPAVSIALIEALFPGRLDLGLGRSLGRPKPVAAPLLPGATGPQHETEQRAANGLLLPKKFDFSKLLAS